MELDKEIYEKIGELSKLSNVEIKSKKNIERLINSLPLDTLYKAGVPSSLVGKFKYDPCAKYMIIGFLNLVPEHTILTEAKEILKTRTDEFINASKLLSAGKLPHNGKLDLLDKLNTYLQVAKTLQCVNS